MKNEKSASLRGTLTHIEVYSMLNTPRF